MQQQSYDFHALANTLPLIDGAEFDELVDRIRQDGLIDPITLWQGKILDGRNRYRACQAAGVEAHFEEFDGDEDAARRLVYSKNITRRHLTDSQKAMAAARLIEGSKTEVGRMQAVTDAAVQAGVSPRTVSDARMVLKNAPSNVVSMVDRGEVSVSRAAGVVRGKVSEADLEADARRRGAGRPVGNSHVNRFLRVLDAYAELEAGAKAVGEKPDALVVRNWPDDANRTAQVAQVAKFLRSVEKQLQELKRVQTSSSAVA